MVKKIIETKQVLITLTALIMLSVTSAISADDEGVESVTIIGSKDDARNLAGSGTVLSEEDLNKIVDTDIHKILSAVPGLYFRTEDGYGLRPNISIRGTSIDRSAKVTLMEDGVLIAPAPYTSASAYYFPN